MTKKVVIRDDENKMHVLDVDRVLELFEKEEVNILGLSFSAIRGLKKWFVRFGGGPDAPDEITVDEVFKKPYEVFINSDIVGDEK